MENELSTFNNKNVKPVAQNKQYSQPSCEREKQNEYLLKIMKTLKKIASIFLLTLFTIGLNSCAENSPKNWFKAGSNPKSYNIGIEKLKVQNGQKSAFLTSNYATADQFGTLMQSCNVSEYIGKKIKMSGFIKSENVIDWSGMWLRIDSSDNPTSKYFDNMRNRPIKGNTDWTKYEIILDVPENSYSMNFGVLLAGSGKVWFDDVNFEIIGDSTEKFSDSFNIKKSHNLNVKPQNLDFEK